MALTLFIIAASEEEDYRSFLLMEYQPPFRSSYFFIFACLVLSMLPCSTTAAAAQTSTIQLNFAHAQKDQFSSLPNFLPFLLFVCKVLCVAFLLYCQKLLRQLAKDVPPLLKANDLMCAQQLNSVVAQRCFFSTVGLVCICDWVLCLERYNLFVHCSLVSVCFLQIYVEIVFMAAP